MGQFVDLMQSPESLRFHRHSRIGMYIHEGSLSLLDSVTGYYATVIRPHLAAWVASGAERSAAPAEE